MGLFPIIEKLYPVNLQLSNYFLSKNSETYNVKNFLMLDLMSHTLSPKFELLTQQESEDFLKDYDLRKSQLHNIYSTDPSSLYYYAKKGQIFRIIRNSKASGKSIAYRIVSN